MAVLNRVLVVAFFLLAAGVVTASFTGHIPMETDGMTAEARTEAFLADEHAVWSAGLSALVFMGIFMFLRMRGDL